MKLPINFLLYTLSAALLGGVGWVFYQAIVEAPKKQRTPSEVKADVESLITSGQKKQPPESSWHYGDAAWWSKLKVVNWIGKLPPKVEITTPSQPTKPVETKDTSLDVVLNAIAIVYHGPASKAVIRYKPTAGVTPPADFMRTGPSDVISTPVGPGAGGRPPVPGGSRSGSPMPSASVDPNSALVHHLKLEDTLWSPYQNVRLVAISADAQVLTFLREKDGVPKEEWKKEEVFRNELGLPDDVNRALAKWLGVGGTASRPVAATRGSRQPGPEQPVRSAGSGWQPVETTRELDPGQWHISERDYRYLTENSERIVNEDVVVTPYRSPQGSRAGLQVVKVSKELAQYGIQSNDVILSINGEPVTSKAQAVQASRKQYDRGTREFVVEVLSRGQISQRTFHAPNR